MKGMMTAASSYGLKARAVKGTKNAITPETPVPFIAHMHMHLEREEGDWADHYVVVKHIGAKHIELWDPDSLEKKKRVFIKDKYKKNADNAKFP